MPSMVYDLKNRKILLLLMFHVFSCINVALLLTIGQSLLCHLWLMLLKTGIEILHFYAVCFSYIYVY
jgi:hypothetical protein